MPESTAPQPRFAAQEHDHSHETEHFAASPTETDDAWQNIARAAWAQGAMSGNNMPDISKQSLNEMLGLNFNPNTTGGFTDRPMTQTSLPGGKSLIDWEALSRGETVTITPISPAPNRPAAGLDPRWPGIPVRPEVREGRENGKFGPNVFGGSARLLEPVRDQAVLARVPDALYIGQKGTVTSTRNRGGETQEYWLAGDAARAFAKAQEILAAKGKQIIVSDKNGAGRTVDTQTEIYHRSQGGRGFAAGKPTSSNHTIGRAMDVSNWKDPDVKRALLAVGWRQGDSRGPIANDLHHFSFAGSPQQDGPPRRHAGRR